MKQGKKKLTIPAALAVGVLLSVTTMLATACVTAWLVNTEKMGETAMGYCALVILAVSTVAGAAGSAAISGQRRLLVCALLGGCYLAFLLACTALFFGGQYHGIGATVLLIMGCATAVGLLGKRGGKTQHRRHYKIKNR